MEIDEKKLLYWDVETVSQYKELDEMPESQRKLWDSYYENFKKRVTDHSRLPQTHGVEVDYELSETDEYKREVYRQTAAFFPEFGKVACVSLAYVNKEGDVKFESFYGENELEILTEVRKVFNKVDGLGFSLCGQNIKGFDIPFLGKRYLIHGLKPPTSFPTYNTKPWELKVVDTKDIWAFGSRGIGSLDLICMALEVESPKNGDVKGDSVNTNYWSGNHDEIKEYCERDVQALVDIIFKINSLE